MVKEADFPTQGTFEEQVYFVLEYAVRAPSTHNSQPWLFRLTDNTLHIYVDWTKKLPIGDVDGRDICISIGACVEHARTAFAYFGMLENITRETEILPDTQKPIATLDLARAKERDSALLPLVHAIEGRFNARGPFIKKEIPRALFEKISSVKEEGVIAHIFTDDVALSQFGTLTGEGMRSAHRNPKFRAEIARWLTNNYSSKKEGIPGYTMLAPNLISLILPWLIGTFNMGGVLSTLNLRSISSSSGCILFTSKDSPVDWVHVGMLFARISLILNVDDVRTSIYVAAIETPEIRARLKNIFTLSENAQFACTFGYPKHTLRQSPRHAGKERMIQ